MMLENVEVICDSEDGALEKFISGVVDYCDANGRKKVLIHTSSSKGAKELAKKIAENAGEENLFFGGEMMIEFMNGTLCFVCPLTPSAFAGNFPDWLIFYYTDIDESSFEWEGYFALAIPYIVSSPDSKVTFYTPDISIEPLERWHDFDGREHIIWGRKKIWGGKFSIES